METQEWQDTAREMRELGDSQRVIEEALVGEGVTRSQLREYLKGLSSNGHDPDLNGHGDLTKTARERMDEQIVPGEAITSIENQPIEGQRDIYGSEIPAIPVDELRVTGTVQLGLFDAGGKRPTSASFALTGGKVGLVDGRAFSKGDVVEFSGTAVITAVKQQDKRDKATGQTVSCEQQHTAVITDLIVGS